MATIAPTITFLSKASPDAQNGANVLVQWLAVTEADTCTAVEFTAFPDRSVQIGGTFGAGGTCVLEGSNDGTNYVGLVDPQGNAISATGAKLEQISEITRKTRPRISAGTGVSLNISMLCCGVRRG